VTKLAISATKKVMVDFMVWFEMLNKINALKTQNGAVMAPF